MKARGGWIRALKLLMVIGLSLFLLRFVLPAGFRVAYVAFGEPQPDEMSARDSVS